MDGAMQDRKPGQIIMAMETLGQAYGALDDRIGLLETRLDSVRFSVPRPSADEVQKQDSPSLKAPLANEISLYADRLARLERRISDLIQEVQV
jgi:hypothetical protein